MNRRIERSRLVGALAALLVIASGQAPKSEPKPDPANRPRYEQLKAQLADLEEQLEAAKAARLAADPILALAEAGKTKAGNEQSTPRRRYLNLRKQLGAVNASDEFREWEDSREMAIADEVRQRFLKDPTLRRVMETLARVVVEEFRKRPENKPEKIRALLPKGNEPLTLDQVMDIYSRILAADPVTPPERVAALAASLKLPPLLVENFEKSTRMRAEESVYAGYVDYSPLVIQAGDPAKVRSLNSRIHDTAMKLSEVWPGWQVEYEAALRASLAKKYVRSSVIWQWLVGGCVTVAALVGALCLKKRLAQGTMA